MKAALDSFCLDMTTGFCGSLDIETATSPASASYVPLVDLSGSTGNSDLVVKLLIAFSS